MELTIRCTYPTCTCSCFLPCKSQARLCEGCKHGWVAHVLDKLMGASSTGGTFAGPYGLPQLYLNVVEPVSVSAVFDVASLVLYGSQAVPVRLKILLDRLFAVLPAASPPACLRRDEAAAMAAAEAAAATLHVLHGLGWSYEDYARGYVLQDLSGKSLDAWTVMNRDEEYIALQQFVRFAETRALAQEMLLQETRSNEDFSPRQKRTESDIRKFIERSNLAVVQSYGLTLQRAAEAAAAISLASEAVRCSSSDSATAAAIISSRRSSQMPLAVCGMAQSSALQTQPADRASGHCNGEPADSVCEATGRATLPRAKDSGGKHKSSGQHLKMKASTASTVGGESAASVRPTSTSSSNRSSAETKMEESEDSAAQSNEGDEELHENRIIKNEFDEEKAAGIRGVLHLRQGGDSLSAGAVAPAAWLTRRRERSAAASGLGVVAPTGGEWTSLSRGPTAETSRGSAAAFADRKRVLCIECNKTFCDKGALKIHHSAVHLKEMHRCTIDGCTLTFSSRRSRNRHSANPNPKLHTAAARTRGEGSDGSEDDQSYPDMAAAAGEIGFSSQAGSEDSSSAECTREQCLVVDESEVRVCGGLEGNTPVKMAVALSSFARWDGPLFGSSKRKRLMPTRLVSATPAASAAAEGSDNDNERSDGNDSVPDSIASPSVVPAAEPLHAESGSRQCDSPAAACDRHGIVATEVAAVKALPAVTPLAPQGAASSSGCPQGNSRQCPACLKVFQNQFSAKIHFQSVHLRLMHRCLIEGCSASFPSKRSRDRHSLNANLHRRQVDVGAVVAPLEHDESVSKRCRTGASESSEDGYISSTKSIGGAVTADTSVDTTSLKEANGAGGSEGASHLLTCRPIVA